MPVSAAALLDALRDHTLLEDDVQAHIEIEYRGRQIDSHVITDDLRRRGLLTDFQIHLLEQGRAAELCLRDHILLELLGEGGMGQVFKARHRILKSIRAVKVIRPDCLTSKRAIQRFYQEARAVAALDHRHIVRAYDAGQDGDRHCFVMEFVAGVDLGKLILQHGPLPVGLACEYIRQAATGLQHAHERGLVHRDIKPSNLLLATEENAVKVLDLGLARLRESGDTSEHRPGLTAFGQMMGTPDYMAPEQAMDSSSVTIQADIYSLGCSLYQLLTASVPFPGGTLGEKLERHHKAPPPDLRDRRPEVPAELAALVARMMAKLPADRPRDPGSVAEALAPFCDGGSMPALGPVVGQDSIAPASHPTQASNIPQTLDLPTAGRVVSESRTGPPVTAGTSPPRLSGSVVPPPPSSPSDRTLMRPPETQISPAEGGSVPAPRRWMAVVVGLALLVTGGIVAAIVWPRERETGPRVDNRPPSDRTEQTTDPTRAQSTSTPPRPITTTTQEKPPIRTTPTTQKTEPAPPREWRGLAKRAESQRGPEVRAIIPGPAGQGGQGRPLEWDPLDLWGSLTPKAQQVVFSRDGKRAAARMGNTVSLFDLLARKPLEKLSPLALVQDARVSSQPLGPIALTPEGKLLFVTLQTTDKKVRDLGENLFTEFDTLVLLDGDKPNRFFGDPAATGGGKAQPQTRALAFSPDGKALVTGSGRKLLRWDLGTQREFQDRYSHFLLGVTTNCLAFTPDGKSLVAGCADGKIYMVPAEVERTTDLITLEGHDGPIRSLAFLGNDHLLSGDAMGHFCIWKYPPQGMKPEPLQKKRRHPRDITCIAASPDRDLFASAATDEVKFESLGSKRPPWTVPVAGDVLALQFSADGKQLLIATDQKLGLIQLTPPEVATVKTP